MPAYLLTQNREILAKNTPVHLTRDSFVHHTICSTLRCTPVYSQRTAKRRSPRRPQNCSFPLATPKSHEGGCEALASPTGRRLQGKPVYASAAASTWPNLLECLYSFALMISVASAEVRTGTISKSIKSRQFAIHFSNSAKSPVCMSCQQILKFKSIQLEMYSSPLGIIRPLS